MCNESLWAFLAWVWAGRSLLLVSDETRTKRGEFSLLVENHNRKLPDSKYVFYCISNEFYYSVFSIFQCHSNVSVDLNANFINKQSLMSICVIFNSLVCADLQPLLVMLSSNNSASPQSSTTAPAVSAGFRVESYQRGAVCLISSHICW